MMYNEEHDIMYDEKDVINVQYEDLNWDHDLEDLDSCDISQGTGNVVIRTTWDKTDNKIYRWADF